MKKITLTIIIATAGIHWRMVTRILELRRREHCQSSVHRGRNLPAARAACSGFMGVFICTPKWENLEYNRRLFFPWPGPNRLLSELPMQ